MVESQDNIIKIIDIIIQLFLTFFRGDKIAKSVRTETKPIR